MACGLRLAACGLRLAACGLRLAACGLRLGRREGEVRPKSNHRGKLFLSVYIAINISI
ncbi:MAG: hypothetical protein LBG90_05730 [Spirochaetaceae bacterium]|nr:hypothetical protein [Spirochaetaceae bacterium]